MFLWIICCFLHVIHTNPTDSYEFPSFIQFFCLICCSCLCHTTMKLFDWSIQIGLSWDWIDAKSRMSSLFWLVYNFFYWSLCVFSIRLCFVNPFVLLLLIPCENKQIWLKNLHYEVGTTLSTYDNLVRTMYCLSILLFPILTNVDIVMCWLEDWPCDSASELVDCDVIKLPLLSSMIGNFQSYPLFSLRFVASADLDIDAIDWSKLWLFKIDLVIQPVNWSISDAIKLPCYPNDW